MERDEFHPLEHKGSDPALQLVQGTQPVLSRRGVGLSFASAVLVLVSDVLGCCPAFAGVGVGVAPTYPALIQVGDRNVSVGMSITNTSTPPESGGTVMLSEIKHTPSCGIDAPVPCPAAAADPGVFLIRGPATGMAGTACEGTTFTITPPNSTTGEVEFIPNSPVILAPVGTGPQAECTISFLVDVLRLPAKDSTNTPGLQTDQLGRVRADASVNSVMGTGTGASITTLVAPTPTRTPTPTSTPTKTPTPTPTPTATPQPTCVCTPSDMIPGSGGSAASAELPPSQHRMRIPQGIDCLSEMCVCPPGPRLPNGLPNNYLTCSRNDPTCDGSPGDKACTFTFRICFNMQNHETRFICNTQDPVTEVRLNNPREGSPKTSVDRENVVAFESALMKLGGVVGGFKLRSMVFNPPLADAVCTDTIPFKVALRQSTKTLALFPRQFSLNYRVYSERGVFDADRLFFRCNP